MNEPSHRPIVAGGTLWIGDGTPPMDWAPIGCIVQNPVTGQSWMLADSGPIELVGGRVPISQFPELFRVLAEAGMTTSDETSFVLPDLRSRAITD